MFRADPQHERSTHNGYCVAVAVAVDRHAHGWTLARTKRRDDLGWNTEASGGLAAQLKRGAKFHLAEPSSAGCRQTRDPVSPNDQSLKRILRQIGQRIDDDIGLQNGV